MLALAHLISAFLGVFLVLASPAQETFVSNNKPYDVQAHRGGRGNTVENTLPSFAWGLVDGATTLELDNGITSVSTLSCLSFPGSQPCRMVRLSCGMTTRY
jgi:hypothetical protein